jgi:hypothetical protein
MSHVEMKWRKSRWVDNDGKMKMIMESVMKVGHESTIVQARESKCGKSYLEPDRKIEGLRVWVGGVNRRT